MNQRKFKRNTRKFETHPNAVKILKGMFGGLCNRAVCNSSHDSVAWYNYSTQKWYCRKCAEMINEENHNAHEIFGHDLCLKHEPCHVCKGSGESPHGGECCVCNGFGYLTVD